MFVLGMVSINKTLIVQQVWKFVMSCSYMLNMLSCIWYMVLRTS